MDKLLKFWPLAVAAFFVISGVGGTQYQIKSHTDSIKDLEAFVAATNEKLAQIAANPKFLQITLNKLEIEDLSESVDENEEWLSELQWSINELEKR